MLVVELDLLLPHIVEVRIASSVDLLDLSGLLDEVRDASLSAEVHVKDLRAQRLLDDHVRVDVVDRVDIGLVGLALLKVELDVDPIFGVVSLYPELLGKLLRSQDTHSLETFDVVLLLLL